MNGPIYFKQPRETTELDEALNPNKPLDEPLTETELKVINVLLNCTKGTQPHPSERKLILNIAQQTPSQWTRTITQHREIVLAVHSFFYGNLSARASDCPCK